MSIGTLLLIILIVVLLGGTGYGYQGGYFTGPYWGGGLGIILIVLVVLLLAGHV